MSASLKGNKIVLSTRKAELYLKNAENVKFLRRNPVMACEILLGIKLMDSQKYILQQSWNTPYVAWACSRNFGKSFLGAIIMILKCLLYENQAIYIISSVGSQSQETFTKIEEIILRMGKTSNSIKDLEDIAMYETVKSPACKTGFSHAQTGFHVGFYNGSEIFTLNGNPDNNRSKRASMVFFDEAGFSSDELITVSEAFATQDTNFITSTEEGFNTKSLRRKTPTQLIYASSASHVDTTFYRKYRDFAKQMFIGNRDFFCADIPCDIPLSPMLDGKPYTPLLQQSKVDSAMRSNKSKALREYYNKFAKDGGEGQIVKWGTIRRSETFTLPDMCNSDNSKYGVAFDPARTIDNSIIGVIKFIKDPNIGWYGEVSNCINLVELASKKGYKMRSPEQIDYIRKTILDYNGNAPDYQNIKNFSIDSGAGGGGQSAYADNLLDDWKDKEGRTHRGFLDKTSEAYKIYSSKYPNASNILKMISPQKYRTQMVDEFIELADLGLIRFPKEYDGKGFINITDESDLKDVKIKKKYLTMEEELALMNIDIMKNEVTSIYKFENPEKTSKSYKLPKDKERKMHDDRFYVLIMLAHYLYELRRGDIIKKDIDLDWSKYVIIANSKKTDSYY